MKAKLLAIMTKSHDLWENLANDYQVFDLDSYVERARILAPDVFFDEPQSEEIDGEVMDENENYILTWEDGIGECERIYQK